MPHSGMFHDTFGDVVDRLRTLEIEMQKMQERVAALESANDLQEVQQAWLTKLDSMDTVRANSAT